MSFKLRKFSFFLKRQTFVCFSRDYLFSASENGQFRITYEILLVVHNNPCQQYRSVAFTMNTMTTDPSISALPGPITFDKRQVFPESWLEDWNLWVRLLMAATSDLGLEQNCGWFTCPFNKYSSTSMGVRRVSFLSSVSYRLLWSQWFKTYLLESISRNYLSF